MFNRKRSGFAHRKPDISLRSPPNPPVVAWLASGEVHALNLHAELVSGENSLDPKLFYSLLTFDQVTVSERWNKS